MKPTEKETATKPEIMRLYTVWSETLWRKISLYTDVTESAVWTGNSGCGRLQEEEKGQ